MQLWTRVYYYIYVYTARLCHSIYTWSKGQLWGVRGFSLSITWNGRLNSGYWTWQNLSSLIETPHWPTQVRFFSVSCYYSWEHLSSEYSNQHDHHWVENNLVFIPTPYHFLFTENFLLLASCPPLCHLHWGQESEGESCLFIDSPSDSCPPWRLQPGPELPTPTHCSQFSLHLWD